MRKLLIYDYRRDLERLLLFIILATGLITVIELTKILGTPNNGVLSIKGIVLFLAFTIIFIYKMNHLSEDTMINREHGMLIPKTPLQIVLSNNIVTFTYALISVLSFYIVIETHGGNTPNFSVFLELLFYFKAFLSASIIFFLYIYGTWFYIFNLKHVKKTSTAQNIVGLAIFIGLVLFILSSQLSGSVIIIELLVKNRTLSGILIFLLDILGTLGVSATVGHEFSKEKVETKLLYIVAGLSLVVSVFIFEI